MSKNKKQVRPSNEVPSRSGRITLQELADLGWTTEMIAYLRKRHQQQQSQAMPSFLQRAPQAFDAAWLRRTATEPSVRRMVEEATARQREQRRRKAQKDEQRREERRRRQGEKPARQAVQQPQPVRTYIPPPEEPPARKKEPKPALPPQQDHRQEDPEPMPRHAAAPRLAADASEPRRRTEPPARLRDTEPAPAGPTALSTPSPAPAPELSMRRTATPAKASAISRSYRELVNALDSMGSVNARRPSTINRRQRSARARAAVLARSGGLCENPECSSPGFQEVTDVGEPILEVDHVQDLALDGADHPVNMVALCPNCHALKTRGAGREALRETLARVARERHVAAWQT
ncbi:HNH endonuclease [Streptomyces sp. NPDC040750]|uniref:HNH endonuclease n=1 Tax=Streptomyces sp. NPDC040750 TaxID=3154491 RepID=UPI0033EF6774